MLYYWDGKEQPLGSRFFVATGLVIETFAEEAGVIKATGFINMRDDIECIGGSDDWKAEGRRHGDEVRWDVQYAGDPPFRGENGRPMFTCQRALDDAIEAFIKSKLNDYRVALPG